MRNSKAKTLRKLALNLTGSGVMDVKYNQQIHKERLVPTGRLNEKGEMLMARFIPITIKLDEFCTRGVYQHLKKVGA